METNKTKKTRQMPPKAKSFFRHTTVRTVIVILILVLAFQLVITLRAPSVISPEVQAEYDRGGKYISKIVVNFGFKPEDFHIKTMQEHGAIAGVSDQGVTLMYVPREELSKIAKIYWVKEITIP